MQWREKNGYGEYVFVRLPNNTTCGFPAWTFDPSYAEFVIGQPVISAEALTELHSLLPGRRSPPEAEALRLLAIPYAPPKNTEGET